MEEFGKHLRTCRKQRRMTQTELARIVGVAPAYVSQIESSLRMPSLKVAKKFADALRVELPVLLGTDEAAPVPPDRMSDPEKLEALRGLVRALELDIASMPRQEDLEPFPGATAIQVIDSGETAVRVYRYGDPVDEVRFLYRHPGTETIYCAAGRLRIVVRTDERVLSAGESFTFDGTESHTVLGRSGSVAVSTVSPAPAPKSVTRVPVGRSSVMDLRPPGASTISAKAL
jgi:putative transcriptional regulator